MFEICRVDDSGLSVNKVLFFNQGVVQPGAHDVEGDLMWIYVEITKLLVVKRYLPTKIWLRPLGILVRSLHWPGPRLP